jgi:hypothetical protein
MVLRAAQHVESGRYKAFGASSLLIQDISRSRARLVKSPCSGKSMIHDYLPWGDDWQSIIGLQVQTDIHLMRNFGASSGG